MRKSSTKKRWQRLKDKEMTSQMISPPMIVTLSVTEEETYVSYQDIFRELGFELSEFGGREYAICAVPGNLFSVEPKELFMDVLKECANVRIGGSYELLMEKVASMSCRRR